MFLITPLAFKIIYSYIPLGIFAIFFLLALFAYIWKPSWISKILGWGIGIFAVTHITRAAYLAWAQYIVWQGDRMGQLFLPPHQPISYFWHYSWTHFISILPWVLGGAAVLGCIVLIIGILSKGRMVDTIDAQFAVFGALIAGWPDMLTFFIVSLAVALSGSIVYGIIKKQNTLIPVTPFFFASIAITFIWGAKITAMLGLTQLIV